MQTKLRFIEAIQSTVTPVYNATLQVGDKMTDIFNKIQGVLGWRNASTEILSVVSAGASSTADQNILTHATSAGQVAQGDILRCVIWGTITKPISPGTNVTFWVKIGATKVASVVYQPTTSQTARPFKIEFDIIIRTIGTSGTLYAMGKGNIQQTAGYLGIVGTGAAFTLDTTAAIGLTLGFNFSNSNASNNVAAQMARIGMW